MMKIYFDWVEKHFKPLCLDSCLRIAWVTRYYPLVKSKLQAFLLVQSNRLSMKCNKHLQFTYILTLFPSNSRNRHRQQNSISFHSYKPHAFPLHLFIFSYMFADCGWCSLPKRAKFPIWSTNVLPSLRAQLTHPRWPFLR